MKTMPRLLFSLLLAGVASPLPSADRPNIVFLLTDDQAPWALGLSGNSDARTPRMDRFFTEGVYFTSSFVVTPVCSPSRASTAVSRYGSEVGITDWIEPGTEHELGLSPDETTWYELLQAAGYETALIGKWHLGVPDRFAPKGAGFDHFFGFREGATNTKDPRLETDGVKKPYAGLTVDLLTDHALEFLREEHDRPFLLCLHFRAPHSRYLPVAPEDWAPYEELDPIVPNPDFPDLDIPFVKEKTKEYLASVAGIDRNLGRLLDALDELKLADDTVVIFTSDHGYNIGHHGVWHKGNGSLITKTARQLPRDDPRRRRSNMFDTSLRVPTAIRWPGVTRAGTRIARTTSNLDWFPTLCRIAKVEVPDGLTVRGRDLTPLLAGEAPAWDDDLYCEYSQLHFNTTHLRAYRTPEWKLIRDFLNEGRDELYHLAADPGEATNLIASSDPAAAAAKKELDGKIREWMKTLGDPVARSLGD